MKRTIPYLYRVSPRPRPARERWQLDAVAADGDTTRMGTFPTRGEAIVTAHILSGARGEVEVLP